MYNPAELKEKLYNKLYSTEYKKLGMLNKLFDGEPNITETTKLANKHLHPIDNTIKEKSFTPGKWIKYTCIAISVLIGCLIVKYITYIRKSPDADLIGCGVIVTLLTAVAVALLFADPTKKQVIVLSDWGIVLEKNKFPWKKILGTYIILSPRRGESYQLVLLLNNDEIFYYSLGNYGSLMGDLRMELSTYIEHFKNNQQAAHP